MDCEPILIVNPVTGQEEISYDDAVVTDYGYRNDVQREHRELEQQAIYEDEDGIHSQFADELEEYEEVEEEYEDEEFENPITQEYMDELYEAAGGVDGFQEILSWAFDNLSEEFIDAYDTAIESNEQEITTYAINKLFEIYNEHA